MTKNPKGAFSFCKIAKEFSAKVVNFSSSFFLKKLYCNELWLVHRNLKLLKNAASRLIGDLPSLPSAAKNIRTIFNIVHSAQRG